jgi:hypothetical protein
MSKTLFNQNTFSDKNVTNSNNVENIKIDTLKVTNATITNLTNTELQEATSGVAANLALLANKQDTLTPGNGITIVENLISFDGTSITGNLNLTGVNNNITTTGDVTAGSSLKYTDAYDVVKNVEEELGLKQDELTSSNLLNPNFVDAENNGGSVIITTTEFGSLTGFDNASGTIQEQIDSKQDELTSSNLLNPNFVDAENDGGSVIITTTEFGSLTGFDNASGTIQEQIGLKQDELTSSNLLNPNFVDAENDGGSVIITTTEFGSLTGFDNANGTIQEQIDSKAGEYTVSTPLVKTIIGGENPTITISVNHTDGITDGSTDLIESGAVFTGLAEKEDAFNVSAPLVKTTTSTPHVLSIDTTNTPSLGSNQLVLGGGVYQYLIDNYNAKLTNGSSLQLSIDDTGSGININDEISVILATSASATDFGLITGNVLNTELSSKQDTLTNAANAGANISISAGGVISATDTNTTYSALSNGGLVVNGSNAFSIDLTNTNALFSIPQRVQIEKDGTPQLLVEAATDTGQEAEIEIRGAKRDGGSNGQARLVFANYDHDITSTKVLGRIEGVVADTNLNIGGLVISNYANGITRTGQLCLSAAGNFNIGGGDAFQDNYKLQVTGDNNLIGSCYIKKGLILDPFDMPVTTFTNNSDLQASATSREDIYIKFAPSSTVSSDWAYLRNIGANNAGHLAFDFHDDANDVRFSIRNIRSSGAATDVITEVFDVFSTGITAHTSLYRIPQMAIYNFNKTAISNNLFGVGNRFITPLTTRTTGASFSSHSDGSITISANGYYRIRVGANPVQDGYNDRLAFCVYLFIGSTEYFADQNYNFHGYTYTRNNSDAAFGNISFEDYIYIASGTAIQVRTKLDTDNRSFDNTLSNSQMECFCNLQIERIAETNI